MEKNRGEKDGLSHPFIMKYGFIEFQDQKIITGVFNKRLTFYKEFEKNSNLYNIYIGRIERFVENINAYFLEIEQDHKAFLTRPLQKDLKGGDEILVQIVREEEEPKKDRVIDNIFLKEEEYLYYPLTKTFKKKRKRISEKEVPSEIKNSLKKLAKNIAYESTFLPIPRKLYESLPDFKKYFPENLDFLVVNNKEFSKYLESDFPYPVVFEKDYESQYDDHLTEDLKKLREKNISLPSGGEIVIEKTESLIAIDMNTKQAKENLFKIALEAVEESIFQMELREERGVFVLDLFHLEEEEYSILEKEIQKLIKNTNCEYFGRTALNLLEFTRFI